MICIIDCGTEWLKEIEDSVAHWGREWNAVRLTELASHRMDAYDGVIISGAPTMLTETDRWRFLEPFQFLATAAIPVLGICLGHQIIGLTFGATIAKGTMISRTEEIRILGHDPLFTGIPNPARFLEDHAEFITVPKGFTLLARSASCANEAMRHRRKKIYGVQFHPEDSGENGRTLIGNFLAMCAQ